MNKEIAQKFKDILEDIKNTTNMGEKRKKVTEALSFLDGYITNILSS